MGTSKRTIAALESLRDALRETVDEVAGLADRCETLAGSLRSAETLGEAMSTETRPLIITRMTTLLDRLTEAGTEVRRAEAAQLREEGYTHERIAETFGVSRQRVAVLLRSSGGRRPFRSRTARS